MNKLICIPLFIFFTSTSCRKNDTLPLPTGETLSFENANIKLELISSALPANFRAVHFFNASTGAAASYEWKIYRPADNGVKWTIQYSNPVPDQPFSQILFADSNFGYVAGGSASCGGTGCIPSGGVILKTTD